MDKQSRRVLLGLRYKNYRKKCGYTQERLCEILNIDVSGYSDTENGKSSPSTDTTCDIMSLLKIRPDELFDFVTYEISEEDLTDKILFEQIKSLSPKNKQKLSEFIKIITK